MLARSKRSAETGSLAGKTSSQHSIVAERLHNAAAGWILSCVAKNKAIAEEVIRKRGEANMMILFEECCEREEQYLTVRHRKNFRMLDTLQT